MSKMPTSRKANEPLAHAGDSDADWSAFDHLNDRDVVAAAKSDHDNPPATAAQLKALRRVSNIKQLRWKLELSQEDFATRLGIDLERLKSWERGTTKPDAASQARLDDIAAANAVKDAPVGAMTGSEPMTYQVLQDADGGWRWRLVSDQGKVLAVSGENYADKSDCLKAISLVQHSSLAHVA